MKDGEFEFFIWINKYQKVKFRDYVFGIVLVFFVFQFIVLIIQMFLFVQQFYLQVLQFVFVFLVLKLQVEFVKVEVLVSEAKVEDFNYLEVWFLIVGIFYWFFSLEKLFYVKVGDVIEVGQVVCIVEVMKFFNEIEFEIVGKIVKVMVEDVQLVEYDQVLFLVDFKGQLLFEIFIVVRVVVFCCLFN